MKVMNVSMYRQATHKALNQVITNKGNHINWSTYAKNFKISKNYGTVLSRIGVVQRVKGGFYKSNINGYPNKMKAQTIVDVIRKNNLINEPSNKTAISRAKSQLEMAGVIRSQKQATAPVTISKAPKATKIFALASLPTEILLAELGRRVR